MADESKQVQEVLVHIFGQEYHFITDSSLSEVQQVAETVNRKMREVLAGRGNPPKDKMRLAVEVAMGLAADLLRERKLDEDQKKQIADFRKNVEEQQQRMAEKATETINRLTRNIEQINELATPPSGGPRTPFWNGSDR